MKRLLLPLLAAIALPTAVNANEKVPYKMTETEGLLNPKINHFIIFTFRFQFIF